MKRLLTLLSALLVLCVSTAHAQSMGQPGFYGRIEIGTAQQPPLLISDAVMGNPGVYTGQPIYMHVPPAARLCLEPLLPTVRRLRLDGVFRR